MYKMAEKPHRDLFFSRNLITMLARKWQFFYISVPTTFLDISAKN